MRGLYNIRNWFSLRRSQETEKMKLVAFRFPVALDQELERTVRSVGREKSEVVRSLVCDWVEKMRFEGPIRLAKEVEVLEREIVEVKGDATFREAQRALEAISIKPTGSIADELQWIDPEGQVTSREKAVRGFADTTTGRVRFTIGEYEAWVRDRSALERVVETYKARVKALKDKIESLKTQIAVYTIPS
jgi:Arc/MetJ-type ribon-helix-helix transcriptional regulator